MNLQISSGDVKQTQMKLDEGKMYPIKYYDIL